jgi:hypothetical protein
MKIQKPKRVTRTYVQKLISEPVDVFPLLCPVREADWIKDWDPSLVISKSGLAEPDCIFITASETLESIWYITRHEAANGLVEMLKITPGVTACKLSISLRKVPGGSEATVTYSHTSLGTAGDKFVGEFTQEFYEGFMQDWESRLNHYLRTGQPLLDSEG